MLTSKLHWNCSLFYQHKYLQICLLLLMPNHCFKVINVQCTLHYALTHEWAIYIQRQTRFNDVKLWIIQRMKFMMFTNIICINTAIKIAQKNRASEGSEAKEYDKYENCFMEEKNYFLQTFLINFSSFILEH